MKNHSLRVPMNGWFTSYQEYITSFLEEIYWYWKNGKDEKRIYIYTEKKKASKIFFYTNHGWKASSGVGSYHLRCWDLLQSHKFSKITLDVSSRWMKICYALQLFILKEFISVFCALRYLGQLKECLWSFYFDTVES